jgi:hypothetical protein
MASDAMAKQLLGPVPFAWTGIAGMQHAGTYAGQQRLNKQFPVQFPIETDHMTPDSLHQPVGQARQSTAGQQLSRALPAASIDKLMHRRKITTGSGESAEDYRAYLQHAHHGRVPFAGRMETTQDHYAAAMTLDMRMTMTNRTLFGETTLHEPKAVTAKQKGVVPFRQVAFSAWRMRQMVSAAHEQGRIGADHGPELRGVIRGEFNRTTLEYANRGLPTGLRRSSVG